MPRLLNYDQIDMSEQSLDDRAPLRHQQEPDYSKSKLYSNFLGFCGLFSVAHATVDAILAFSTAELGGKLAADSGFLLYIFYTISALFLAKPCLKAFGSKYCVCFGLCGMFAFAGSFFISISVPSIASTLFLVGATVGGLGAGVLWPAQSLYFEENATRYTAASGCADKEKNVVVFAAIFVACYLSLETAFKLAATAVYLADTSGGSWRSIVFGFYAVAALLAIIIFYVLIVPFYKWQSGAERSMTQNSIAAFDAARLAVMSGDGYRCFSALARSDVFSEVSSVIRAAYQSRIIQAMIPFQIVFGLSAGFVNTYISGVIVNDYLSDGYIGLLSGISTLGAVALIRPSVYVSNNIEGGKWYVMMFGGLCFLWAGIPLLLFSDKFISSWGFIVPYFIVHGAARSVWENTNKAVMAEYFAHDDSMRAAAFASIYVFSGISGAFGYLVFRYMGRLELSLLNVFFALLAMVGYHFSFKRHMKEMNAAAVSRGSSIISHDGGAISQGVSGHEKDVSATPPFTLTGDVSLGATGAGVTEGADNRSARSSDSSGTGTGGSYNRNKSSFNIDFNGDVIHFPKEELGDQVVGVRIEAGAADAQSQSQA